MPKRHGELTEYSIGPSKRSTSRRSEWAAANRNRGEQNALLGRAVIGGLMAETVATLLFVLPFSACSIVAPQIQKSALLAFPE